MKSLKGFILLVLFITLAQFLHSAPPPPPGGSVGPKCWPPPCVPIDGGVSLLIMAGAAYGAKKIYKSRKNSSNSH
ncbi:MAG: PID-CTERM protein-sorting domain-containing protein [Bacteroidia bacterium]